MLTLDSGPNFRWQYKVSAYFVTEYLVRLLVIGIRLLIIGKYSVALLSLPYLQI